MAGWPQKITRATLGPTFENASKITNPKRQIDAAILNVLSWQLAGMNGPAARGLVRCTLSGTTVTVTHQWFAWDPNQALDKMQFTRSGAGVFTWELPDAGVYDDAAGEEVAANLIGAFPMLQGTANLQAIADVDSDGNSGTLNIFDADAGTASDATKWLMLFY